MRRASASVEGACSMHTHKYCGRFTASMQYLCAAGVQPECATGMCISEDDKHGRKRWNTSYDYSDRCTSTLQSLYAHSNQLEHSAAPTPAHLWAGCIAIRAQVELHDACGTGCARECQSRGCIKHIPARHSSCSSPQKRCGRHDLRRPQCKRGVDACKHHANKHVVASCKRCQLGWRPGRQPASCKKAHVRTVHM